MTNIQVAENLIIDLDEIVLCKRIKKQRLSEQGVLAKGWEFGTEIVLKGDRQIYQYWGDAGNIIWNLKKDSAFPAYVMDENISKATA